MKEVKEVLLILEERSNQNTDTLITFEGYNFKGIDFQSINLQECEFVNCKFDECKFMGMLHETIFQDCEFLNSKFNSCVIHDISETFVSCKLTQCELTNTWLSGHTN